MKLATLLFAVFVLGSNAHADPKAYYYRRYLERTKPLDRHLNVQQFEFEQYINPDNPTEGLFQQRYFIDSEFAQGLPSPVLFYLCGEGSCNNGQLSGAIVDHAKSLKAHLVSLEHRYYGKSQPFKELTRESLRFLSLDNALKDAARFQLFLRKKLQWTGPWIVIGGSYAGALSADYRLKYPTLIAASLASSAPVAARENFEEFDRHVAEVAGSDCAPLMRKVSQTIEAALAKPEIFSHYKTLFNADELEDPTDFLYVVADMGALAIQYGFRKVLCDALESSSEEALVETYAEVGTSLFDQFGITPLQDSAQGSLSIKTEEYEEGVGVRQWYYQSCTQFGYWQTAYRDPELSVRSHLIDLAYHRNLCKRLFGIEMPPDTAHINEIYYLPIAKGGTDRILFTNGFRDPWSLLSITKELKNSTNAGLTLFTIANGAHCDDLGARNGDSSALTEAKDLFEKLVKEWIN